MVIVRLMLTSPDWLTRCPNSRIVRALTMTKRVPKASGSYSIQPTMMATNNIPVMARCKKLFFKVLLRF